MKMTNVKKSPAMVLVLSIITCGFYYLYWIYQVSDNLRPYNRNDSMTPGLELLLSIVCFPYIIYWNYKYGRIIYDAQANVGMPHPEDNSILYLVLSVLSLGVIGACIMQSSLNKLWDFTAQE